MTTRPPEAEVPEYFRSYVDCVPDGDIIARLAQQFSESLAELQQLDDESAAFRYAPGKWSLKEIAGHLADTERIFAYRALRFARSDSSALPGFDENAFVQNARFDRRSWDDLLDEWTAVRHQSITFFQGLDDEELGRRGSANQMTISVRALAWVIAGHERHHMQVMRDRYLRALGAGA